ncbi:MAG: TetR/AcrR family transcriptional regulator [Zoogloeaceae bacterium]|nr:TetR/AcrR family transcriptional regulator [Zoogloeaceae bacterium]
MARRGDHSREEIRRMALDAAEALVAVEGYKGFSARKVASAIHYTVGTLYLVFENLDDLVLQVNGRTLDKLFDWLSARRGEAEDPEAALLALSNAYIAYAAIESPRWSMLFDYTAEKGDDLPEWYQRKLGRVFGLVEAALRPLAREELEIQRASRVLWASVHGICILRIRQRMNPVGNQDAEGMVRMLIENFLRGFCA